MRHYLRSIIRDAIECAGLNSPAEIVVEYPRDMQSCDAVTPVAFMIVRGNLGDAHGTAERIVQCMVPDPRFAGFEAQAATNGYINIRCSPAFLQAETLAVAASAREAPQQEEQQTDESWPYPTQPSQQPQAAACRAHANIAGILRHAGERGIAISHTDPLAALVIPEELALMRETIRFADRLNDMPAAGREDSVRSHLAAVTAAVEAFWVQCRIFPEPPPLRNARLTLLLATKHVLGLGLAALGIQAPERI